MRVVHWNQMTRIVRVENHHYNVGVEDWILDLRQGPLARSHVEQKDQAGLQGLVQLFLSSDISTSPEDFCRDWRFSTVCECKTGDKLNGARHSHLSNPSGEFFRILPVNIFGGPILYCRLDTFHETCQLEDIASRSYWAALQKSPSGLSLSLIAWPLTTSQWTSYVKLIQLGPI